MKYILILFFGIILQASNAQHTFSIVALDTITGEVGGAGATCYTVVNDIADVHPGVGFIHTQSYVDYNNQAYAHNLMESGILPEQIMDSLQIHDATGQPQLRQYAAVMFNNGPHAAAFTGTSCYTYYGSRIGRNYAIAGNILLGSFVLDSMESKFLHTQGTLADKLMAALQGAKVVGADKRCLTKGVSSLSAYIIVAKPTDVSPLYYLSLNVENVLPGDPIDTLQNLYDQWQLTTGINNQNFNFFNEPIIMLYPNPVKDNCLQIKSNNLMKEVILYNNTGSQVLTEHPQQFETKISVHKLPEGIYLVKITDIFGNTQTKKFIK